MKKKARIAVTRKLPATVETQLGEIFDPKFNLDDTPFSESQLIRAVNWADILVPTVTDQVNAKVINAAGPNLKLIANFGVGVNHIDLEAAEAKGIQVSNTPDVLTEDTADLAMALIIMASRRLGEGERMVRAGDWTGWTPTQLMGNRVSGRSLGIIGMGRIGQALAKRARGFGMSIHYHNRKRLNLKIEHELKAKHWRSLDGMIANMEIISINTPLTPSTANILNAERLKRMQPSSVLINTSRGGLIDEEALVENLMKGRIAAAALDVFDGEPHVNPKLMDLENVVLLPHLGSATIEGRVAMGDKVILNAKRFIDGYPPPDKLILKLP